MVFLLPATREITSLVKRVCLPYFFQLLGKGKECVGSGWEGCLSTGKYTKVHMMFRKRFTPYLLDTLPPSTTLLLFEVLLTRRQRIYLTKMFGVQLLLLLLKLKIQCLHILDLIQFSKPKTCLSLNS